MKLLTAVLTMSAIAIIIPASATTDATGDNQWISVGVPIRLHQGTLQSVGGTGDFYLEGNDHGRCNNVRPTYFRLDMSQPHFKTLYASILYASANDRPLLCVTDTGCGTDQVWVHYCQVPLK